MGMIKMKLSHSMRQENMLLKLKLKPREFNQAADDFTNEDLRAFDPRKRVEVCWQNVNKEILDLLSPFAKEFANELQDRSKRREMFKNLLLTKRQKMESKTLWEK